MLRCFGRKTQLLGDAAPCRLSAWGHCMVSDASGKLPAAHLLSLLAAVHLSGL